MNAETLFNTIASQFIEKHDTVAMGKMMSSPAITYKGKVFAFYHKDMMTFKLGEAFEPESLGITEYQHLAPFKKKPPMRAWFSIPYSQHDDWQALAEQALNFIQTQ